MEEYQLSEGDQHAEEATEEDFVCERSNAVRFPSFLSYSALLLTVDFCADHARLSNIGISLAEKIEEIGMFLPLPYVLESV